MTTLQYRSAVFADAAECIALRGRTRENAISAATLASMGITAGSWGNSIETGSLPGCLCTDGDTIVGYCFGDKDTGEIVVLATDRNIDGRRIKFGGYRDPGKSHAQIIIVHTQFCYGRNANVTEEIYIDRAR